MGADRWCSGAGGLWILCHVLLAGPILADEELPATLTTASWRLQTVLGAYEGDLLVLSGPERRWRLEIATTPPDHLPGHGHLLGRRGDGWTLTLEENTGFLQPWHAAWRALSPPVIQSLDDLLERWLDSPTPASSAATNRRWHLPERRRPVDLALPDLDGLALDPDVLPDPARHLRQASGLRRRLVDRGLGRGATGLGLKARWTPDELYLHSARWPGGLSVRPTATRAVVVPDEAFLPLWPLADLLP